MECLGCGEARTVPAAGSMRLYPGECPRCADVGWAISAELSEPTRRRIRAQRIDRRPTLYAV